MPSLFMQLLAAHLVGDFVLQSDQDAARKTSPTVLARHAAVHAALLGGVALARAITDGRAWGVLAALLVSHAVIDACTSRMRAQGTRRLWVDQAAHGLAILAVVQVLAPMELQDFWRELRQTLSAPSTWTVLIGALVAIWVGGVVVGLSVHPYAEKLSNTKTSNIGLENAGRLIGKCERALIFVFILTGSEALIGFVVAAKALMRLPEARDPETKGAAEYYLIGTLLSVAWAVITGYAVRSWLH